MTRWKKSGNQTPMQTLLFGAEFEADYWLDD
jgi:hypothetical protein